MADSRVTTLLRQVHRLREGQAAVAQTDRQLLEQFIQCGEESAFSALMRRHGPLVWSVCRRLLGNEQDAEDVFQATFLVLARQAGRIRCAGSLSSWLYGVAQRLALRARADRARRRSHEAQAHRDSVAKAEDNLLWSELRAALDEELGRLPEKCRTPLLLCYFEGLTQDEAARRMGCKHRTVKARIERGRRLLRVRLSRRGLSLGDALTVPMLAHASAAVPADLFEATTRAALLFTAGRTAERGAASASVIALAKGGLHTMLLVKSSLVAAALLMAGLFGGTASLLLSQGPPATPPRPSLTAAPVKTPAGVDRFGDPLPAGAMTRLGTVRFRHDGYGVNGLAFLPDGKTLVTSSGNGWVRFWEASSGKLLREFHTDKLELRGLALSRDGKYLAIGGFMVGGGSDPWLGFVRVLDTATGKEVRSFSRPERDGNHCSLVFTPDAKFLASLGGAGAVRIEEIATGTELLRQKIPGDVVSEMALSPDGNTMALWSGPNSHRLYLWDWQSGEEPRELQVPRHVARHLCFSPDSKLLAASANHEPIIRLWDTASKRLHKRLELRADISIGGLAFHPDAKMLAVSDSGNRVGKQWSGSVLLLEPETGKILREMLTPGESPGRVVFSSDGRWLAAVGGHRIHVWDVRLKEEVAADTESHTGMVAQVAASARGVIATASDDHTVRVWDSATGGQLRKLQHGSWVRSVAVSPDGRLLVSSSLDDFVRLWNLDTGKEIYRLPGHGELGGKRLVGFTPDGKRFLSWGDDLYLRVWDVATGKAIHEHRIVPSGIQIPDEDDDSAAQRDQKTMFLSLARSAFSGDGKRFILAVGASMQVFDVETGKEIRTIKTEQRDMNHLIVSPDGELLLTSGYGKSIETRLPDGRVRFSMAKEHPLELYDLETGKCLHSITLPGEISGPVAFSADGKTFAAAIDKPAGAIRFWDTATGAERPSINGFHGRVNALAFTPDGRRLISAMDDTSALIWDLTALPRKP
jgi:RNA polymerase sigma factor (sigma-70 family)